jgi:cyclopropane-fatty-acyl-phospholipid synthase
MLPVLRAILERVVRKGTLEIETASGSRFTARDGSGERVAVRLADSGAAWQLIVRPELALGELYIDGRIVVTQGSVCEVRAEPWGLPASQSRSVAPAARL